MTLIALCALWYISTSIIAFTMFWWDKQLARNGRYRTSEMKLFATSFLGGWPGSYLGRHFLRHKTRKPGFGAKLAMLSILNLAALTVTWLYIYHNF